MSVDWSDLADLRLRVRPLSVWPGAATPESARLPSPFKGTVREQTDHGERFRQRKTPFGTTIRDLRRELDAINAQQPELQLALRDRDIRLDGFPRADARLVHPGVILAFNLPALKGQRLTYAVDRFTSWQDNLRAVALGLEALRKVQRYGMGSGYEQYAGYRALPQMATQTPEKAREVLAQFAGLSSVSEGDDVRAVFRLAAKNAQQSVTDPEGTMNAVMNAARTLGVVT
jgi:hypothetical protein